MSREIKFRGQKVDTKEWIYGFYTEEPFIDKYGTIHIRDVRPTIDGIYVIPETVGQYTGLKDKKGKEIYEGDIIELVNEEFEKIKVICEFGTARRNIFNNTVDITGFYFKRLCDNIKTFPIVNNYLGKHDLELFKVIGNIYENPELVEVENE